MNMIVGDLFDEVDKMASLRNHEVILSIMHRLCNYQKAKLKLEVFSEEYKDKDIFGEDFLVNDDYLRWKVLRSLRKKIIFKKPCGLCPMCLETWRKP